MNAAAVNSRSHVATIALAVAIVLIFVAVSMPDHVVAQFSPAAHFRLYQDVNSLAEVLQHSLREGDSVAKIESLLGPGNSDETGRILTASAAIITKNPAALPAGLEQNDEFLGYKSGSSSWVYLQLREGRLINFNPADYAADKLQPILLGQ